MLRAVLHVYYHAHSEKYVACAMVILCMCILLFTGPGFGPQHTHFPYMYYPQAQGTCICSVIHNVYVQLVQKKKYLYIFACITT